MALSNHMMVALGILTRRAKETVGLYKAVDILETDQQAFDLMASTILSGDESLISLTLELNKALKIAPNLIQAMMQYDAHMQAEGQTQQYISQHRVGLKQFSVLLYQAPDTNLGYREAVDAYLQSESAYAHEFCLNLSRQFYLFWLNTHQEQLESNYQKSIARKQENLALLDIWDKLDNTFLTTIEESVLNNYTKAIQSINITAEQVALRQKLAKLILIKQRDHDKTQIGYRQNINAIDDFFSEDKLLPYFLAVSREFYSIWSKTQIMGV